MFCPGGVGLPVRVEAGNYSIGVPALAKRGLNDTLEGQSQAGVDTDVGGGVDGGLW